MVSKRLALKIKTSSLCLLCLCLFLLVMNYTYPSNLSPRVLHPEDNPIKRFEPLDFLRRNNSTKRTKSFDFLSKEFKGVAINIGLVNMDEEENDDDDDDDNEEEHSMKWYDLGNVRNVRFDRVSEDVRWEQFFPEWIDEDEKTEVPRCHTIPMPRFEDYGEFDTIIARVPCDGEKEKRGIRDVFRLQVHLVVANLVVRNGRKNDRPVVVVFVGSCGPMWEIFRCEDLVKHEGDLWVYRPDLRRLKQILLLPVGSCQLAMPAINHGNGKIEYDASRLKDSMDQSKEAYVTVLHSSEDYVCGAIALAQSIIQTNSTKDLVLLADKFLSKKSRRALTMAGWKIKNIERIRSPNAEKGAYNEWNYSKLRLWQLKEYDKIMFIDADLIVLENLDRFFTMPQLSAVGNDGVLFNSGIMLIEPSECVFKILMDNRAHLISYNGGDQGYLNEVFTWWHRLPSTLNRLKVFPEGSSPSSHELRSSYAIHYLGYKPWMCYRDYDCNWDGIEHQIFASDSAHRRWWKVYHSMPKKLHPYCRLSTIMDSKLMRRRERARKANFSDGHWRIQVKDPRKMSLMKRV